MFAPGITRRDFCRISSVLPLAALVPGQDGSAGDDSFRLRYIVASCMHGTMELQKVLASVRKCGAEYVDIWPERHANHREQIESIGHERFAAMLMQHRVQLGIISRYDLGPFALADEMRIAKSLGAKMLISSSRGPKDLEGTALKAAVKEFTEAMKPHVALAEELGITIGIENHGNSLMNSLDSIRYLAELSRSKSLGIALAPYHLPQDTALIAELIGELGKRLVHFYAWQYGKGCMEKLPKDQELLQMPGRGPLDFAPILVSLKKINYRGWTEIFMHPVPRGIPILPAADEVVAEINRARRYLEKCLAQAANV